MTSSERVLQHRLLGETFGVELRGVDGLSTTELSLHVKRALDSHLLVLLRFKRLSQRRHLALAAAIGPVAANEGRPAIRYEAERDAHTSRWHSDLSWAVGGDGIGLLYCVRAQHGCDRTAFADMVRGERMLSDPMRDRLDGLRGFHLTQAVASGHSLAADTPEIRVRRRIERLLALVRSPTKTPMSKPTAVALCGVPHPLLDHRADQSFLRLGHHISTIDGHDPEETKVLLDAITNEATSSENVWSHAWRRGDLLIYDNTRSMHRRIQGSRPESTRLLRRIQVWKPVGLR